MEPTRLLRLTAAGGVVLVAIMASRALGTPALVLMIGPGIAVPLGLSIALEKENPKALLVRSLSFIAPIGAAAGVLGWLFPPGDPKAMAAAGLHLIVCFLAALLALTRFLSRRQAKFGPLHEFAHDLGLGLLAVAGIWFFASRAAMPLIGFHEPVVTFTAAHFHFAGFAAPTIIGGVGRFLFEQTSHPKAKAKRVYQVAATAICAGIPLTAIGIATNHTIEATAAVLLASGMLVASALIVFVVARAAAKISKLAALLFAVSGSTLLLTMSLAATFALTSSAGRGSSLHGWVPLQTMIDYHGLANAVGFSLSGLTALLVIRLRLPTSRS